MDAVEKLRPIILENWVVCLCRQDLAALPVVWKWRFFKADVGFFAGFSLFG